MIQNDTAVSSAFAPTNTEQLTRRRSGPTVPAKPRILSSDESSIDTSARPQSAVSISPPSSPRSALTHPRSVSSVSALSAKALSDVQAPIGFEAAGNVEPKSDIGMKREDLATPTDWKDKLRAFGRTAKKHANVVRDWTHEPLTVEGITRPFRALWSFAKTQWPTVRAHWKNPNVRATVYGVAATGLSIAAIVGICVASGGILVLPTLALGVGISLGFASFRAFFRAREDAAAAAQNAKNATAG